MQEFSIKTVQIRECRRCKTMWAGESVHLDIQDQINFIRVTIGHCPACAEGFAAEVDRPSYRRTGKKIR